MNALDPLFYPRSIAVVGASKDPTKRGFRAIQKLLADGFEGPIYPVNPREEDVLGIPAYADLDACPGAVDLALICTPARTVPDLITMCGRKGVRGAVVLAGGFAEAGAEGELLQRQMVEQARQYGVRIVGPNTSGIFNTHARNNIVGFSDLRRGDIGILSQSGNMALALVTEAQASAEIGLSTYIGVGNESDIALHEYLDYFGDDANTKVVVAYVEGMKDGVGFLQSLRRVGRKKPVVLYKSGRTEAGQSAARSHTGALAARQAVSEGVLRQAGAVLARRSDDILPLAEAFALQPAAASRRVAVLADGGGHATISADLLAEHGLALAPLSDATREALTCLLPSSAALANPIDVAGGSDSHPRLLAECARVLLDDPSVDALLISGIFGGYGARFSESLVSEELESSRDIADLQRASGKPVLVHSVYGALAPTQQPAPLQLARRLGIPVSGSLERVVRCLQGLVELGESRRIRAAPRRGAERPLSVEHILNTCRSESRDVVLEHEARAMLAAAGAELSTPALFAPTGDGAVDAFRALGGRPVAVKVVSPHIIHKTEAGGVVLDVRDEAGVRRAFDDIRHRAGVGTAAQVRPSAVSGVLVAPMAPSGLEVILGVFRDPTYGAVMMFGLGGVLVEVLNDVVFRSLPLGEEDAREMLSAIRGAELLRGVRGRPGIDQDALVRLMVAVSDLCTAFPEIAELDLNPVRLYREGVAVLDARILLTRTEFSVSGCPGAPESPISIA